MSPSKLKKPSDGRIYNDYTLDYILGTFALVLVTSLFIHYIICIRNKKCWRRTCQKLCRSHSYKKFDTFNPDWHLRTNYKDDVDDVENANIEVLDAMYWGTRFPGGAIDETTTLPSSNIPSIVASWKWVAFDGHNTNDIVGELKQTKDAHDSIIAKKDNTFESSKTVYQFTYNSKTDDYVYITTANAKHYAIWDGKRLMFYTSRRSKYPHLSFCVKGKGPKLQYNKDTTEHTNAHNILSSGIELSNLEKIQKVGNDIIKFICEGGTVVSFQQGDLYIMRKVGVAAYILTALHHENLHYNIEGGVPPCGTYGG
jgi:hypothetical protein